MRETIERRICDCCGKVAEHDPSSFGGMPYPGWQTVLKSEPPFSREELDACSTECAIKLLTEGPPLTVPSPLDHLVAPPPVPRQQDKPSGYVADYPTTGQPLATPEAAAISETPVEPPKRVLVDERSVGGLANELVDATMRLPLVWVPPPLEGKIEPYPGTKMTAIKLKDGEILALLKYPDPDPTKPCPAS